MPTVSKETLEWIKDEIEEKDATIASLTDDLIESQEEVETLRIEITRMMVDRTLAV